MKKFFYVLVLISFAWTLVSTVSCKKTPTFEEMRSAELKIIRQVLQNKNIEVLAEYPANGVFGENQFVQLNSGIYLNVVDSGNGNRAVLNQTTVLIRTSGEYYKKHVDSVMFFDNFRTTASPFEFKYGNAYGVVNEHLAGDDYYFYFSMGLESILSYVGEGAVVKLIVPGTAAIGNTPACSTFQSNGMNYTFIPIYYNRVKYTFYQ